MKLNNSLNIITTDDITLSGDCTNIGNSLDQVLVNHDKDIDRLKKNVSWLYTYGGSGSGGGSTIVESKFEYTLTLTYTEIINGVSTTISKNISTDDEIIIIPEGKTCKLNLYVTSNVTQLNTISFGIKDSEDRNVGGAPLVFQATLRSASKQFVISKNDTYTVTIDPGSVSIRKTFSIYTADHQCTGTVEKGMVVFYAGGQFGERESEFVYRLTSYIPSYTPSILKIVISYFDRPIYTNESPIATFVGSRLTTQIPLYDIIGTQFGVYKMTVNYSVGNSNYIKEFLFVYKNVSEVFIYCTNSLGQIYNLQLDPVLDYVKSDDILVDMRIYPKQGDSYNELYNVIFSDDEGNELLNNNYIVDTTYSVFIPNPLPASSDKETKEYRITVSSGATSYNYYIYVKSPDVITNYASGIKVFNYTTQSNPNNFPAKVTSQNYIIGNGITYTYNPMSEIKLFSVEECSTLAVYLNKGDIIDKNEGSNTPFLQDCIISMYVKTTDSTAHFITINGNVELHSNYIKSGTTQYFKDLFRIPSDGEYHLIQLYFKARYNNEGELGTGQVQGILCIDGVFETQPFAGIDPNRSVSINFIKNLNIQYSSIDVAFINPFHSDSSYISNYDISLKKYFSDFDPIIPAFYNAKIREDLETSSILGSAYGKLYAGTNISGYKGNKYTKISDASLISELTSMPIFCIVPDQILNMGSEYGSFTRGKDLHPLLEGSEKAYGEDAKIPKFPCLIQRYLNGQFIDILGDDKEIKAYIKYQGSSTLGYTSKNYEIGINNIHENDDELTTRKTSLFNPFPYKDAETPYFKHPEATFNLKEDLVDSSHCNNTVTGAFVNDVCQSPFNTVGNNAKTYETCLRGIPVILLVQNNIPNCDDYVFLGIYNLNLNRKSYYNLGYKDLPPTTPVTTNAGSEVYTYNSSILNDLAYIRKNVAVAEVEGNFLLYDYSLYDETFVRYMLGNKNGDFYITDGTGVISENFDRVFTEPFKQLNVDVSNLIRTYSMMVTENEDVIPDKKVNDYYTNENSNLHNDLVCTYENLNRVYPSYRLTEEEIEENPNITTKVTNPSHLFLPIFTSQEDKSNQVAQLNNGKMLMYFKNNGFTSGSDHSFDYKSELQYYLICEAFGLVDSVQKNRNFKCVNTSSARGNKPKWHSQFYDMDTGYGVTNSGGAAEFRTSSDYVYNSKIYLDCYVWDGENYPAGWFDAPSTYLTLFAKYYGLSNPDIEDSNYYKCPYNLWTLWRNVQSEDAVDPTLGCLESADKFYDKYIKLYFPNTNALIWNLNYLYKYFSYSSVQNSKDSEISKFHGRGEYTKRYWLSKRWKYLDALFGFNNPTRTIHGSSSSIVPESPLTPNANNTDCVILNSAFPSIEKGASINTSNITINAEPNLPFIVKTDNSAYNLYITGEDGYVKLGAATTSNTACGFYGSTEVYDFVDNKNNYSNIYGLLQAPGNTGNNIINKYITTIRSEGKTGNLNFKLNDIPNIKNITLSNSQGSVNISYNLGSNNLRFDIDNLTLSGTFTSINLSNLNVKNLTFSNVVVGELIVDNCQFSTNILNGIANTALDPVSKVTIQNCVSIPNLSTPKSVIKELVLYNVHCSVTINHANGSDTNVLERLSLGRVTGASYFKTSDFVKLESISVLECSIGNLQLGPLGSTAYTNNIITSLDINNGDNNLFSCSNFKALEVISFNNHSVKCDHSFHGCSKLQEIKDYSKLTLAGTSIFSGCHALTVNEEFIDKLDVSNNPSDLSYLFYMGWGNSNQSITSDLVLRFIDKCITNGKCNIQLSYAFCGSNLDNLYCTLSKTELQIPREYTEFESALPTFSKSTSGIFSNTKLNYLSYNLANKLKGNGEYYALLFPIVDKSTEKLICENKALTLYTSLSGSMYNASVHLNIVFVENNNLIGCPKISSGGEGLLSSGLKTLSNIAFYTSSTAGAEVSLDFSDGLPGTLTSINTFPGYANRSPIIADTEAGECSLLYIFKNLTKKCTVSFTSLAITNNSEVDLYKMLIRRNVSTGLDELKANFKLKVGGYKNSEQYSWWTFKRTCTYTQMLTLINLFAEVYNSDKEVVLDKLFYNCVITDCNKNTELLKGIIPEKGNTYSYSLYKTFANTEFKTIEEEQLYVKVDNLFGEYLPPLEVTDPETGETSKISPIFKAKSINLRETFMNAWVKKFESRFNAASNVSDFTGCFYNAKFENSPIKNETIHCGSRSITLHTFWEESDEPIVPNDFFSMLSNSATCDLCFASTLSNKQSLFGKLPENKPGNWPSTAYNIFRCCKIYPNIILEPTLENPRGKYYVFPQWYSENCPNNGFEVLMPVDSSHDGYFFYKEPKSVSSPLPYLTSTTGSSAHYAALITNDSFKDYIIRYYILNSKGVNEIESLLLALSVNTPASMSYSAVNDIGSFSSNLLDGPIFYLLSVDSNFIKIPKVFVNYTYAYADTYSLSSYNYYNHQATFYDSKICTGKRCDTAKYGS